MAYFDEERHATGKLTTRLATDAPMIKGVSILTKHEMEKSLKFFRIVLNGGFPAVVKKCAVEIR